MTARRAAVSDSAERARGFWSRHSDVAGRLEGPHVRPHPEHSGHPWWQVMCLTGVDYFSTLGYQPGIAVVAAGALAPVATVVLVAVTLLGALPVYRRVAQESPHGAGSIAMLERLVRGWGGKTLVLILLGFALTDFLITITLSASDAAAHAVENPFASGALNGRQVEVTVLLILLLGALFFRGYADAIGVAVAVVVTYLVANAIVLVVSLARLVETPAAVHDWNRLLVAQHPDPLLALAAAMLIFPRLALGLSGFETGVAVMPLVRGDEGDREDAPTGRIRNTRKLLTTAAVTMSGFLLVSSFCVALLVPAAELQPGGRADGRALSYLAHQYLGAAFGNLYDVSTIAILSFAGASAMAGMLNLVPRYLPRYGMAPHWTQAMRPLVVAFTAVAIVVTVHFHADVNAQGGAYATGVLVLMTSAAVAVTLSARRRGRRASFAGFGVVSLVLLYTTVTNVIERPDGVRIASVFIVAILVGSVLSRTFRAFELRVDEVVLDPAARAIIDHAAVAAEEDRHPGAEDAAAVRLVALEPERDSEAEYQRSLAHLQAVHRGRRRDAVFIEVVVADPSDFSGVVQVQGLHRFGHAVLVCTGSAVPNTIAALALQVRDLTGHPPLLFFAWTEGNPLSHLVRYVFLGSGEVASVTQEVLREAEPDPAIRPRVHAG